LFISAEYCTQTTINRERYIFFLSSFTKITKHFSLLSRTPGVYEIIYFYLFIRRVHVLCPVKKKTALFLTIYLIHDNRYPYICIYYLSRNIRGGTKKRKDAWVLATYVYTSEIETSTTARLYCCQLFNKFVRPVRNAYHKRNMYVGTTFFTDNFNYTSVRRGYTRNYVVETDDYRINYKANNTSVYIILFIRVVARS